MSKKYDYSLSIIIPFFNEEESLPHLVDPVMEVLTSFAKSSEVILVDDGSTDGSAAFAERLAKTNPQIKFIQFRRNFGQTAAWSAGIDYATGDLITFLDSDLQNNPVDIPRLVDKLEEGFDVVSGWRKDRQDKLWSRKIPSWIANSLISAITKVNLHDYGCSLKIYRKEIIKSVRLYGEMHRFLPAYTSWEGARVTEMPVSHSPRKYGKSHYSIIRTFKVVLDLITVVFLGGFLTKPIYFFGSLGGIFFLLGLGAFSVVAYRTLFLAHPEATPMVFMMAIFFIASIQFVLMGLLAEIAVRTYHETHPEPVYRVKSLTNLKPTISSHPRY